MHVHKEPSVQVLEKQLQKNPKSLVFSRLADFYRKSGDIQQAISICINGLTLHPNNITGRIILGRCYLEQENINDALEQFSEVCKLDRRNQLAIKMVADIFSKRGIEEKAGNLYALLLSMDPDNQSLIHLTSVFKCDHISSILDILGMDSTQSVQKTSSGGRKDETTPDEAMQDTSPEIISPTSDIPSQPIKSSSPEVTMELEDVSSQETSDEVNKLIEEVLPDDPVSGIDSPDTEDPQLDSENLSEILESTTSSPPDDLVPSEETFTDMILSDSTESSPDVFTHETSNDLHSDQVSIADEICNDSQTDTNEAQVVLDSVLEENVPLDEILSSENGVDTNQISEELDSVLDIQENGEDQKNTKSENGSGVTIPSSESDQPILVEEEPIEILPQIEDISQRMDSMFGEEEGGLAESEEIAVLDEELNGTEQLKTSEEELPVKSSDQNLVEDNDTEIDIQERLSEGLGDEFVSRVEDMFSEGGDDRVSEISDSANLSESDQSGLTGYPSETESISNVNSDSEVIKDKEKDPLLDEGLEVSAIDLMDPEEPEIGEKNIPDQDESIPDDEEILDEVIQDDGSNTQEEQNNDQTKKYDDQLKFEDVNDQFSGTEDEFSPQMDSEVENGSTELEEINEICDVADSTEEYVDVVENDGVSDEAPLSEAIGQETVMYQEGEVKNDYLDNQESPESIGENEQIENETSDVLQDLAEGKEKKSGNVINEATAIFDREIIRKIAASEKERGKNGKEDEENIVPSIENEFEESHSLTGEEVISRLDEMFPNEGSIDENIDDIPESELSIEQPGVFGIFNEKEGTEDLNNNNTFESEVSNEGILPSSERLNTYSQDHDLEIRTNESNQMDIDFTGDDLLSDEVVSRIDTLFADDESGTSAISIDSIPDEDVDEKEAFGEFYNETGDSASFSENEDSFSEKDEREERPGKKNEIQDSLSEETSNIPQDLQNTIIINSESGSLDKPSESKEDSSIGKTDDILELKNEVRIEKDDTSVFPDEESIKELIKKPHGFEKSHNLENQSVDSGLGSENGLNNEIGSISRDRTDSIPDHVLTPTLADIYFQQNQPYLAIQIYKRLFTMNPENERIASRIEEIEQVIQEREAKIAEEKKQQEHDSKGDKKTTRVGKTRSNKKGKKIDSRPLKGKKIKKKYKERILKKKR